MYLGIDFGTSTNYIVRWNSEKNKVEAVNLMVNYGSALMGNAIYYGIDNVFIGENALEKRLTDPKNLVRYIKVYMGDENYERHIPRKNRKLKSMEIAIDIFKELKSSIEKYNEEKIDGVVITIPFGYMHKARKAIKQAAQEAGFNVISLIEEPLAAAIRARDILGNTDDIENVLVFDIGGGTLDITVFKSYQKDGINYLEVLNTDGDKQIGGRYIDEAIFKKIKNEYDFPDLTASKQEKIFEDIKSAKELLSEDDESDICIETIYGSEVYELDNEILSQVLRDINYENKINYILDNVIDDSNLTKNDINRVILVGGTSRLKAIRDILENQLFCEIEEIGEADLLVGEGAAIYANELATNQNRFKIIPSLNHSIGIDKAGEFIKILEKNSKYGFESEIKVLSSENNISGYQTIDVYQGDYTKVKECSKVGVISFEANDLGTEIGLSFSVDTSGIIMYKLYDIRDKQKNMIKSDELN